MATGELTGKVAIVTGGNSGIGKAIVLALARAGANIVIDYVSNEEATDELEQHVAKLDDLQRLIDTAVKSFGRLDILVNNAGIETRSSILDTTEHQYEAVMA